MAAVKRSIVTSLLDVVTGAANHTYHRRLGCFIWVSSVRFIIHNVPLKLLQSDQNSKNLHTAVALIFFLLVITEKWFDIRRSRHSAHSRLVSYFMAFVCITEASGATTRTAGFWRSSTLMVWHFFSLQPFAVIYLKHVFTLILTFYDRESWTSVDARLLIIFSINEPTNLMKHIQAKPSSECCNTSIFPF